MNTITRGSTNVFSDLGFVDAAERQTKTRLAMAVKSLLTSRKLKQREIAPLLGIPQPKVSALKNYRLVQFSIEELMEFQVREPFGFRRQVSQVVKLRPRHQTRRAL